MITQAGQDYLKVIYKLSTKCKTVNTKTIAKRMHVSQASVTGMLKKLAELKLLSYRPYYGVKLTGSGRKIALETIRHHRLLELYLSEAMGYSWDAVHDEAEKLEHVISEEFEDKIAEFLGDPTKDPHGAPIPSKEGVIEHKIMFMLTEAKPGQKVRVERVSDEDPEMLRYLGKLGIYPNVEVDIMEKPPFGGALLIKVNETQHHLGEKLTNHIYISEIPLSAKPQLGIRNTG